MPKFRKKPVVIEARLFDANVDYDKACDVVRWAGGVATSEGFTIDTLEGPLNASHGDWIIRGVKGEFYPCKPDIFEATYEPIEGDDHAKT
jgi:hypothetical protein